MDRPRDPEFKRKRRIRRIVLGVFGALIIAAITLGLAQLEPAAPTVNRQEVWVDTVKRGEMVRQVRGPGTLVPEDIRWISVATEGVVEKIIVHPGTEVKADTVILELSNPELEQQRTDSELALRAAEAEYQNRKVQLESQLLNQKADAARIKADFEEAKLQAQADTELADQGLVPEINRKRSNLREAELDTRNGIEQQRLAKAREAAQSELASQRARLEQLREVYRLRKEQVQSLHVRPGIDGVLQQVPVEVGQRVPPGTPLARVADPATLKAELRIPETQAKDLVIGQKADIDTRNGIVGGHVTRIDPAVQAGSVTVDVAFDGPLPKGARPDLSVDGTIEIERLENVLYVGRPAYGQAGSTIQLFKLIDDGDAAVRVPVQLGRSSVNTIEIVQGLKEGDKVILSDTSRWDGQDRLRLE